MKKNLLFLLLATVLSLPKLTAQGICNPAGNLLIYSNYDGGNLIINIDENIPDIRIGLCSYQDLYVTITGDYVGNVTSVLYAGFNADGGTSITGVDAGIVEILNFPLVTLFDADGYGYMICAYECDTTFIPGGCNTVEQVTDYFLTTLGGSIRYGYFQYGVYAGTYTASDGGNCCVDATACTIAIDGGQDQTICIGDSVQLNGVGAVNYSWFPETDLDDAFISNPYASPTSTITYYVTGTDADGCSGIDTVTVFVSPLPVPMVTVDGFTLTASGGSNYQWLLDAEIIPGATGDTHTATENGFYSVIVTSADGCVALSESFELIVNDIYENYIAAQVIVFPNPSDETININMEIIKGNATVELLNASGQKISTHNSNENSFVVIPVSAYADGVYYIRIIHDDFTIVKSCIIKH